MAPKDALLGTLKVCIMNLQSDGNVVTDSSAHLPSCCELLEFILRKGLQQPVLSLVHRDYWHCFELLPQYDSCGSFSALALALDQSRGCKKLLGPQGRGRYLLRLALSRRGLGRFVTHLLHTPRVLEWYSSSCSILRNEESVEPFMSLLLVLSQMDFQLEIENCSFLDESWLLPVRKQYHDGFYCRVTVCEIYETVPCRELGMVLRYLRGRVFVLELLPGSQAQVDRALCPGDIIDEINGVSLRNSKNGQAGVVLSRLKGLPLSLRVLRWRARDGSSYRPLIKLLRELRTENPTLDLGLAPSAPPQAGPHRPPASSTLCLRDGRIVYVLQYLGKANIGMCGGKEVLQQAIPQVLQRNLPSKEVYLDLKETHLICTEKSSNTELFQHHYPEISCVGRFGKPDYTIFAFCVADSPETHLAPGFCCVALRTNLPAECEELVCRIATGFKHTEWFV
ncbi:uncharacterized protein si:ch211-250n8.1 isoform X2 [Gadus macrocephalus]|uniref:uncharacterized protein si:ch211-250n8.1 isoform X2 n=1 Tax=Gadus macrocephalus TaxID=80720 RepID=UPI0028CB2579|nr:uncharacterized protein si:ch211-250n8.1 isoform X2 [Gadus macrocephalus]